MKELNEIDKSYYLAMKNKKKYMDTMLLMEMLYETYCYSGDEYNNMNCDKLLRKMIKINSYNKREIDLIKQNAIRLLKIKYEVSINNTELLEFNR